MQGMGEGGLLQIDRESRPSARLRRALPTLHPCMTLGPIFPLHLEEEGTLISPGSLLRLWVAVKV